MSETFKLDTTTIGKFSGQLVAVLEAAFGKDSFISIRYGTLSDRDTWDIQWIREVSEQEKAQARQIINDFIPPEEDETDMVDVPPIIRALALSALQVFNQLRQELNLLESILVEKGVITQAEAKKLVKFSGTGPGGVKTLKDFKDDLKSKLEIREIDIMELDYSLVTSVVGGMAAAITFMETRMYKLAQSLQEKITDKNEVNKVVQESLKDDIARLEHKIDLLIQMKLNSKLNQKGA